MRITEGRGHGHLAETRLMFLPGEGASRADLPRCRYATEICAREEPPLVEHGNPDHVAACHHPLSFTRATAAAGPPPEGPGVTADEGTIEVPGGRVWYRSV